MKKVEIKMCASCLVLIKKKEVVIEVTGREEITVTRSTKSTNSTAIKIIWNRAHKIFNNNK